MCSNTANINKSSNAEQRATCHIRMSIVVKQVVLSGPELQLRQEDRLAEEAARQRKKGLREKALASAKRKPQKKQTLSNGKKPETVDQCLRKFFEDVMELKRANILHERMCKAGKHNDIPIRYLLVPPSSGQLAQEAKLLDSGDVFDSLLLDGADGKLEDESPEKKRLQNRKKLEVLVFVYYASYGGTKEKSLSLSNFMKFVDDVHIISDTVLEVETAKGLFNELADKNGMLNGSDFPELLNNIAYYAWPENKRKDALINQWHFHDDYINPRAGRAKSDPMTLTLLFNEKVNKVLAEFKWPLWCLYKHFRSLIDDVSESSSEERPETDNSSHDDTIDWDEFSWLLTSFNIVGPDKEQLSWETAKKIFNQTNIGEIGDDDVDTLTWEEFIECICRIALAMFPLENNENYSKFKSAPPTVGLKRAVDDVFESQSSQEETTEKRKWKRIDNLGNKSYVSPRKLKEMKNKFSKRSARRVAMFVFARKKKGYTQEEATADLDKILKINPKYFSVIDAETIRAGIKSELQTAAERFGTAKLGMGIISNLKFRGKKIGTKRRFGIMDGDAFVSHSAYLTSLRAMHRKASALPGLKGIRKILDLAFHKGTMLYGQMIHNGKDLFDSIDDDRDGKISDEDLSRAMQRMNIGLKKDAIDLLINHIHHTDNIIELGHFLDAITQKEVIVGRSKDGENNSTFANAPAKAAEKKKLKQKNKRARQSNVEILRLLKSAIRHKRSLYNHPINSIKDIFEAMDQDGSKYVEGIEIENAFKRLGFGLSDYSTCNFISQTDVDFDNKISFREFESVLLGKDLFSKLSKDQNKVLNSPRVHIYEAAQIIAKYMDKDQDRHEIIEIFESYDHSNNGRLELQQFLGGVTELCGLSNEDTRKVLYLIGGEEDSSISIDYLEFVHHLDSALQQRSLENQRDTLNKTLEDRKEAKHKAPKRVRDLWDLVYEPPKPKQIFDEDQMKGKFEYLQAMKVAPLKIKHKDGLLTSQERDWSRVGVTKRLNELVDYTPPIDSPIRNTAINLPKKEGAIDRNSSIRNQTINNIAPKKPTVERKKASSNTFSPRRRKMSTMKPYKRKTSPLPKKTRTANGMPLPSPIFSRATHTKFEYAKAMKVPFLDMKSVKLRKSKTYIGASKSSRSWARKTVKDRLQAVSNGCAHSAR